MTTMAMTADVATESRPGRAHAWAGRIVTALPVLFLTMDATMHLLRPAVAVQGTVQLGFPASMLVPLGIIQVIALALYLTRRTSVVGAILWTGYLGGAVAAHVRIGDPLFADVLAPVYVAVFLWAGLWLRDARLRTLLSSNR